MDNRPANWPIQSPESKGEIITTPFLPVATQEVSLEGLARPVYGDNSARKSPSIPDKIEAPITPTTDFADSRHFMGLWHSLRSGGPYSSSQRSYSLK